LPTDADKNAKGKMKAEWNYENAEILEKETERIGVDEGSS
jgi:hypothetical protein